MKSSPAPRAAFAAAYFTKPLLALASVALSASVVLAWDLPDPTAGTAKSAAELQTALDSRPAVRESLGFRSAQAMGEKSLQLTFGMSVTDAAANPEAYRIVSFDDPDYAYKKFVRPASAKLSKEAEAKGVEGSLLPEFAKTVVDLELPQAMKPNAKYFVVAQGVGGAMVTAARTAAPVKTAADKTARDPALDQAVIGLRRIEPVGNGILLAEFGPGFAPAAGAADGAMQVTVNGKPAEIAAIGRITRVDAYIPVGWPFKAIPVHEVAVQLAQPFKDGDKIQLGVSEKVTAGNRSASLDFREGKSFSPSIKVNQIGYLPDSPVKVAYLGRWLGDFPVKLKKNGGGGVSEEAFRKAVQEATKPKDEAAAPAPDAPFDGGPALYFAEAPAFQVRAADTGAIVFEGKTQLVHKAGIDKEGLYGSDYAGENVYALDFTAFKTPGRYFLSVPGVGRSPDFAVAADVYEQPFQVQSYGVFAQRSGQELDAPNSPWRRVASLVKGIVPTTLSRYVGEGAAFGLLPKNVERGDAKPFVPPAELATLNKDPDLLAWWPLDGSGADASGHGHNLSPLGDKPEFTAVEEIMPGKNLAYGPTKAAGNGFKVDGISLGSQGATFSLWVKGTGGIKFGGTLVGDQADPAAKPAMLVNAGWGVFRGFVGQRGEPVAFGRIADGKWHHVALVYDPSGGAGDTVRAFLDGLPLARASVGQTPLEAFPFLVGALDGDEPAGKFLDEVRVYGRALNAAEIAVLARKWGETSNAIAASGGHHDAGDYNPRSHIEVATILMSAYEMAPQKFRDRDLGIPEAGNGIPDILDEAAWAMRLWPPLQREDGAVRAGTESNGDPNFVQTVDMDTLGDFAYAPDAEASFTFAATFAQAARIWRGLGKGEQADKWLAMAEKAYTWADANKPEAATPEQLASRYLSPKAWAAAELLHTTGNKKYNDDFLKSSVWAIQPDAPLDANGLYDQQNAAWAYLQCPPELCDAAVRESIHKAIIARADEFIKIDSTLAYKTYRHPHAPISWGTGAYPHAIAPLLWAWKLTGDPKYMEWIVRSADFTLGANPLGRSFVIGLGDRTVRAPLHNSRYSHFGEVVPGIHVQGPLQRAEGYSIKETAHPKIREDFAPLYNYVDAHFAIAMNEGTIPSQVRAMALFGLLRPDAKPQPDSATKDK